MFCTDVVSACSFTSLDSLDGTLNLLHNDFIIQHLITVHLGQKFQLREFLWLQVLLGIGRCLTLEVPHSFIQDFCLVCYEGISDNQPVTTLGSGGQLPEAVMVVGSSLFFFLDFLPLFMQQPIDPSGKHIS